VSWVCLVIDVTYLSCPVPLLLFPHFHLVRSQAKLNTEIEELKSAASQRAAKRAEVEKAQGALSVSMNDVTMTELSESATPAPAAVGAA
jgi:hypothetical protein